jgi:hypothetical protein
MGREVSDALTFGRQLEPSAQATVSSCFTVRSNDAIASQSMISLTNIFTVLVQACIGAHSTYKGRFGTTTDKQLDMNKPWRQTEVDFE